MMYDKVDPEKIIEELKRIIDRLNAEKKASQKPNEKNIPNSS